MNLLLQVYVSRKRMGGVLARRGLVVHLPERLAHLPRALRTVPAPRLRQAWRRRSSPCPRRWTSASGRISTRCANSRRRCLPTHAQTRGTQGDGGTPVGHVPVRDWIDASAQHGRRAEGEVVRGGAAASRARGDGATHHAIGVAGWRDVDARFRVAGQSTRRRAAMAGVGGGPCERAHLSHRDVHAEQEAARRRGRSAWRSPSPSSSRCRPSISSARHQRVVARVRERSTSSTSRGWCCPIRIRAHTDLLGPDTATAVGAEQPDVRGVVRAQIHALQRHPDAGVSHALPPKLQRASRRPDGVRQDHLRRAGDDEGVPRPPRGKDCLHRPAQGAGARTHRGLAQNFAPKLGKRLVELTGDYRRISGVARADIIVATPEKWDGISRQWQSARMSLRWRSW